ncbi:hypothetical protein RYX36_029539 [Vicia faba]
MTQKESTTLIVKDYQLSLTPEQFIKEINPLYIQRWREAKEFLGANRIIKHFLKNGVPVALASNSLREYIYAKIPYHEGNDQVKFGKPAPDLFEEAAKRMSVNATNCLVFEDSLVGVKAAHAAKNEENRKRMEALNLTQLSQSLHK